MTVEEKLEKDLLNYLDDIRGRRLGNNRHSLLFIMSNLNNIINYFNDITKENWKEKYLDFNYFTKIYYDEGHLISSIFNLKLNEIYLTTDNINNYSHFIDWSIISKRECVMNNILVVKQNIFRLDISFILKNYKLAPDILKIILSHIDVFNRDKFLKYLLTYQDLTGFDSIIIHNSKLCWKHTDLVELHQKNKLKTDTIDLIKNYDYGT